MIQRIEPGHYQSGIYHVRHGENGYWVITVEDGKGLPFEPMYFPTLREARIWLGCY